MLFCEDAEDDTPVKKQAGSKKGRKKRLDDESWTGSSWARYLPIEISGRSIPHACWDPSTAAAKKFQRRFRVPPEVVSLLTDMAHTRLGYELLPVDCSGR